MVFVVGMIALVIIIIISVSKCGWYDFCLNKGNVFIFQVIFFQSDLNKLFKP